MVSCVDVRKFSRGFIFAKRRICEVSLKENPREMAKTFCRLLLQVNQAYVAIFNVANMSFNAIRKNKILAQISEFTY